MSVADWLVKYVSIQMYAASCHQRVFIIDRLRSLEHSQNELDILLPYLCAITVIISVFICSRNALLQNMH